VTNALAAERLILLHSPKSLGATDLQAALDRACTLGGTEPMTEDEAAKWAVDAAKAIRMLGLTGSKVFDVSQTVNPLAAATKHKNDEVRVAAAEALATLEQPSAQQAIADLASDSAAAEVVRIAAYQALSDSARRFRNYLNDEQAQAVLDVVTGGGSRGLREAAAEALGALNLASDEIKDLILGTAGRD
jgi:HEAT repeat protein